MAILSKFPVSGGSNLNFDVVAYSSELLLPATAKENTIAVITEIPIAGWVFVVDTPVAPYEGMIWFQLSTNTDISFNILRKNEFFANVTVVRQYANGAWVNKVAKVFMGGEWKDSRVFLYNEGNTYNDVTNGWGVGAATYNGYGTKTAPTITYGTSTINFSQSSNSHTGFAYMRNPIDLTPYKSIVFTLKTANTSNQNYMHFAAWPSIPNTDWYKDPSWLAFNQATVSTAFYEKTIDVTNVNQLAYIGIGVYADNTVYVQSIRLERL